VVTSNPVPPSYTWSFGDGATSTNQNPTHTYTSAGRYVVELTVQDATSNTARAQIPVTVFGGDRKMSIEFPGYVRTEVLSNFPALVVFGTNLTAGGFSYSQAASNGWDLLFLDSTGTKELPYEIERWNTNSDSYVWVRVPELSSTSKVWAYWGDTNLARSPSPSLTNGAVWANGYAGIWHLGGGTVSGKDSSSNHWPFTIGNALRPARGIADGAVDFFGTIDDFVGIGTANPVPDGTGTISVWLKPNATSVARNNYAIAKGDDNGTVSWGLNVTPRTTDAVASLLYGSARWLSVTIPYQLTNTWHMMCAVLRPDAQELYFDGVLVGTNNLSTVGPAPEAQFYIGKTQRQAPYAYAFNGTLDEARVATAQRGSNWVWAEWMTVNSNAQFNKYGPVVSAAPETFELTQVRLLPGNQFVFEWPAPEGRLYAVESSSSFFSEMSQWTVVATNLAGTAGWGSWTGPVSQAAEFFRVRAY